MTRSTFFQILLVGPDTPGRAALQRTLTDQLPVQVRIASDPLSGAAHLLERRFLLILAEHRPPRIDGIEFLRQARYLRPEGKRVLVYDELSPLESRRAVQTGHVQAFLCHRDGPLAAVRTVRQILPRVQRPPSLDARLTAGPVIEEPA